jgi:hypothetical protein
MVRWPESKGTDGAMAWQRRGRGLYYYRSDREGGRVVSCYCGAGSLGETWAEIVAANLRTRSLERRALRECRELARDLEGLVGPFLAAAAGLAGLAMVAAGYCRHDRSRWHRSRTMGRDVKAKAKAPRDAGALLARAAQGDQSCYDEVMALLDEPGRGAELVASLFSLANIAKNRLIDLVAGEDYALAEGLMRNLNLTARMLAGPAPSPIEPVLAERIAVCQFVVWRWETRAAEMRGTMPQIEFENRQLDRAHGRLVRATEALARVRRLALPELRLNQVNIAQAQQVNNPGADAGDAG